jgi:hypothetical protein
MNDISDFIGCGYRDIEAEKWLAIRVVRFAGRGLYHSVA